MIFGLAKSGAVDACELESPEPGHLLQQGHKRLLEVSVEGFRFFRFAEKCVQNSHDLTAHLIAAQWLTRKYSEGGKEKQPGVFPASSFSSFSLFSVFRNMEYVPAGILPSGVR